MQTIICDAVRAPLSRHMAMCATPARTPPEQVSASPRETPNIAGLVFWKMPTARPLRALQR